MTRLTPFSMEDVFKLKCWAPLEQESTENVDACDTEMAPSEEDEKTIMEKFRKDTKENNVNADFIMSKYRLEYEVSRSQEDILFKKLESAVALKKETNRSTPEKIGDRKASLKCLTSSKRGSEKSQHEKRIKQHLKRLVQTPKYNKSQTYHREHKIKRTSTNRQKIRFPENVVFKNRCLQSRNPSFCRKPILKKRDNWLHKIFLFLILLQVTAAQENPAASSDHDNEFSSLRLNITFPGTLVITWGSQNIHVHHTPESISERTPNPEAARQEQDTADFEKLDMMLLFGLFVVYNVTLYSRQFCRVTVKHKDQLLFSIVVTKDTTVGSIFRRVQISQVLPGSRTLEGYFRSRNCPFLNPKKVMHDILEPMDAIDICLVFIEAT